MSAIDQQTADAFANSWNNLPSGSVYTREQFEDWLAPLTRSDVEGREVVELGCGNGSLLVHMTRWEPRKLIGVDLGSSVKSAQANLANTGFTRAEIQQGDLTKKASAKKAREFDLQRIAVDYERVLIEVREAEVG